jgi:alkaline phosphatase D
VFSRRQFLSGAAASLAFPALSLKAQGWGGRDPFTLGVASGCPSAEGVVLWTRLAPDPLQGGGMGEANVEVNWELADDERFTKIAARGKAQALAQDAHSVHVELHGLQPARTYWYRFAAGGARSAVGRTRTAPAAGTMAPLRFAFASCQQYEQGYYAAYRDMATQPLDFVLHLGDYIYESSWGSRHVRHHEGGIPTQLEEFRNRYAMYKSDADLQSAHAAFPWFAIWDDHEVANDYTDDRSSRTSDAAQFLAIRAAAYRAWYEHMPVPASMRPRGASATIHGSYRFGEMLQLVLLDGRQYRSHHSCLDGRKSQADCEERSNAARTFLGENQERWLGGALQSLPARWTVIGQTTLLAQADRGTTQPAYWMDGWDGYPAARDRLLGILAAQRPRNALVVSGDVHAFWAADLHQRSGDAPIATEFVGGAITSEGPSAQSVVRLLARNPHLRWGRGDRRGYAVMSVAPDAVDVEFRAVDDEKDRASPVRRLQRFSVAEGKAGVRMEST